MIKFRDLHMFKSKNMRMFFFVAVGLMTLMLLFFFLNIKNSIAPKGYIAFSFIWLAPIISVCFIYLVPKKSRRTKKLFNIVIGLYMPVMLAANTIFSSVTTLYTLIAVDFFLTFGILVFGMMLFYLGNMKDT